MYISKSNLSRPIEDYKVPGFNLRALNCCLTLKFGEFFESYDQLAKMENKIKIFFKWPRNQTFEEISEIFCHHENVRHSAKIQYFEL